MFLNLAMFLAVCALSVVLLLPSSDSAAIRYGNLLGSHYYFRPRREKRERENVANSGHYVLPSTPKGSANNCNLGVLSLVMAIFIWSWISRI